MAVKVAINGYGTIGKRVAHAVALQDDMEIVGVTKTRPTYQARMAIDNGLPFYAVAQEHVEGFEEAGFNVQGTLDNLLDVADVVVDCSPGKYGAKNLETYKAKGVKMIFQGGEKHETAGLSFNALANYDTCLGADSVRVVSCNTTGLCRTLYPVYKNIGIENVIATMVRRAADPGDSKKGPINAITPVLKVPSHHGPDAKTIMPDLNIQTLAVAVPTTIMHLHCMAVKMKNPVPAEEILSLWDKTPRVRFVKGGEGIRSTAEIMEFARDLNRDMSDMYEIVVWRDGVYTLEDTLYYYQAIHQESDVVPENVDAIRAMFELESDNMKSMAKTDEAMGLGK
jgi:glyceraldehyde-3-phosphate dehydrogenase (NAD(P))